MKLGKTLYVTNGQQWRAWLQKKHKTKKETWLVYYKKYTGKPRIPYNDAVDEALCFGWIDGIVKSLGKEKFAQRFTPRRKGSPVSMMNKERIRRMIKLKKMRKAGLDILKHPVNKMKKFSIAPDILRALKRDKETWKNFQKFPSFYKRIRIAYIEGHRPRQEIFRSTLRNFLKMTKGNKRFGLIRK